MARKMTNNSSIGQRICDSVLRISFFAIALGLAACLAGYVAGYEKLLQEGFVLGIVGISVVAACLFWQSLQ